MASQFLPIGKGFPGSASNERSIYPIVWNPLTRRVESDDPSFAGYTRSGVLNVPKGTSPGAVVASPFMPINAVTAPGVVATTAPGVIAAPGSGLPAIFGGVDLTKAANQQFVETYHPRDYTGGGSSQVIPLNVPTTPGVSAIAVPRSPNISAATGTMFDELRTLKDTVANTLKDFNTRYPEWQANQDKTAAVENAATNRIFNGEEQSTQNALLADYTAKANAANTKSIADTQRLRSRALLASGAGASSAVDRGQFATIADINARAAAQSADRALSSNQWLTQLQQAMAGSQAARNRLAIGDTMLPATVNTQAFENILRQLAVLAPVELQNLMTGVVGPGGYVGDSIGGLQAATQRGADMVNSTPTTPITMFPNGQVGTYPQQQRSQTQVPQPTVTTTTNWYRKYT